MDAYRITDTDADDRLNHLVGRVEAGESIDLVREGRIVARIVPTDIRSTAGKPRFDWNGYFESIKDIPVDPANSVAEMRKEARY